ncbi:PREDICTED: aspartyl/asparaginyl beta-hydroxylase-like [Galeopterus variegatus]|uniref:Aspartyl/asparaginyl beta-hydroxylase-like n=1 Tax=Galeopterus variegatus TaxID=482537 RepID=A0ABM0SA87_GALVR|nr:PREDICTED: aspartyl/asparaginyl beta-hydroxylase-like [Galeopterus variegatus]
MRNGEGHKCASGRPDGCGSGTPSESRWLVKLDLAKDGDGEKWKAMGDMQAGEDLQQEEDGPTGEPQAEDDDFLTAADSDDRFETLEPETFHEETEDSYHVEETVSQDDNQDIEDMIYEQENPDSSEPVVVDDGRLHHDADDLTHQHYEEQVYEPSENEGIEISDSAVEDSNITSEVLVLWLSPPRLPAAQQQPCLMPTPSNSSFKSTDLTVQSRVGLSNKALRTD